MNDGIMRVMLVVGLWGFISEVSAGPGGDVETIRLYFQARFPEVPLEDYIQGVYALDERARAQWETIEAFPPYEFDIDNGRTLFETPFANGGGYADCFENGGIGIKQHYPVFDPVSGRVVTLPLAVNECRHRHGAAMLAYGSGDLVSIVAYMAYTSRGLATRVVVPGDPRALRAYEEGKRFFYARRGQLNMACATCHIANAGKRLHSDRLGPALGQTTHFPAYRDQWGGLGSLHRRYAGCNQQVRAQPFALQSDEYRHLEYFHTYMSNGLPLNGPALRR